MACIGIWLFCLRKKEKKKKSFADLMKTSLAFAEARLILARVLYNFDIELDRSSQRWLADQKSYAMWDKPQLNLKLTPVVKMRGE